ncbi:alpha-galactosidase [Brachybacterium sp. AOP25-B2-12]|uniref:alpha-galactosidase n=1 Tax=Brachybacterium sp. AOP25-B2-12 TaxID=3457710 RepID=UPI0040334F1F
MHPPASASSPADPQHPLTRRVHLRAAGVSLLLDVTDGRIPAVLHWGADLGELTEADAAAIALLTTPTVANNAIDTPLRLGLLPQLADGWVGTPGISGARDDGSGFAPRLRTTGVDILPADATSTSAASAPGAASPAADGFVATGPGAVRFDLADADNDLAATIEVELLATGIARTRATLTNTGATPYTLDALTLALPVPLAADEVLDLAGRWGKERTPQRSRLRVGTHLRENRRGRTGPDSAYLLHVGRPGFDFRTGEIWAVHTAFSGNHRHLAERSSLGAQVIGGGELLLAGEGRLDSQDTYQGPWVHAAYSPAGLDGIAQRFHRTLRARPQHVDTARPVTLNVWEAVYFDHDLARLRDLADRAAQLGVERYVLDDGWFGSRRDDRSGLGDWVVSDEVWPDGLGPLIDHVTGLGMQFGLWFEPEMVNEDSDVARAHPEWIMAPAPDLLPLESRHQQVLNLSIPEAWQHVHDQMHAILSAHEIAYVKWDHNRDLVESATRTTGAAATHAQTLAVYRLMDTLKAEHPGLEIESCSSGGARVDLEVLERTDRVWVSDCIDPLERQQMNRWTAELIPLELMGSHIASGRSHTTGRLHSLAFRAATALFGHLGIEWDLAQASAAELTELTEWITLYKRLRGLLLAGDYVRGGGEDDALWLTGVISADRDHAIYEVACVRRSDLAGAGPVRLPGLDPGRRYTVRRIDVGERLHGHHPAPWEAELSGPEGVTVAGSALSDLGIALPEIPAESALLLELTVAVGD